MSEQKWPKVNLVKVSGVVIGIGTRIRDNHPITIDEVYLNTLMPDIVVGKSKKAKQRRKEEEKKYNDSVAAAKEAMHRWNSHDKLQAKADSHDALLAACKGLMEEADNGSARFDDPEPGSIFIIAKQAIAKAGKK